MPAANESESDTNTLARIHVHTAAEDTERLLSHPKAPGDLATPSFRRRTNLPSGDNGRARLREAAIFFSPMSFGSMSSISVSLEML